MRTILTAGGALAVLAAAPGSLHGVQDEAMDTYRPDVVVAEDCTQPNASRTSAKRAGGPLGWLMRGGRDDRDERDDDEPDAEGGRHSVSVGYYLRSPLLTSLFSTVPPCPTSEKRAEAAATPAEAPGERCVLLLIRGGDGEESLDLRLPYMGATTLARLRAVVSEHQARGEALLVPHGAGETELAANAIREVRPGRC